MSYSPKASRRLLPLQLLCLPLSAVLIWVAPHPEYATRFDRWYLAPIWILLAHLLTAFAYLVTSRRLRRAWLLLLGSVAVYGSLASATHLAAAFLIALAEESIFRLVLLPWLADHTGPAVSVLLVSVLFSALHGRSQRRSRWAYVDYFLFGVVLGAVTLATRTLLPAVVLHTWRNYILRCLLASREEAAKRQAATAGDEEGVEEFGGDG